MKLLIKPSEIKYLAVSGGRDSVSALRFLLDGKHQPAVVYFDHGTQCGSDVVSSLCASLGLTLIQGELSGAPRDGRSLEEYWRDERMAFFNSLNGLVATAHHLDDAVETWLLGACHGKPRLPHIRIGNVCRPFLVTPREELHKWSGDVWVEDPMNQVLTFPRVRMRKKIIPEVLRINPGIHKTVTRLILESE